MKIAFFELEGWEQEILKQRLKKHSLMFFDGQLTDDHLPKLKNVDALCVFVYSKLSPERLDKLKKTRKSKSNQRNH